MQKILSTKENFENQKISLFNSSSAVFWGIIDRQKNIDTKITFLNHFLIKRNIKSVSMRLSVRTLEGILIKEVIEDIFEPKVYSYSMLDLLAPEIVLKELSIYVEFTSNENS